MPREFVLNRPGFFVHDALSHNEYITPDTLNTPRRLKQKVAALAPFCHDELLLGSNYEPIAGKSKRSTEFILRGSRPCNRAMLSCEDWRILSPYAVVQALQTGGVARAALVGLPFPFWARCRATGTRN
jgi:hypothetical protein